MPSSHAPTRRWTRWIRRTNEPSRISSVPSTSSVCSTGKRKRMDKRKFATALKRISLALALVLALSTGAMAAKHQCKSTKGTDFTMEVPDGWTFQTVPGGCAAGKVKRLTWQDKNPRFFYGSWRLPGAAAFSLTTPPLPNGRGGSRYSNRHGREVGASHVSHSRPAIQTPGATPHQASFPSSPEPCGGAWPRIPCLSAEGGLP